MAIYSTASIDKEYIKVRWKEPYVSNALNTKMFGVMPKGIYSGFVVGPSGLGPRDIQITTGSVSGGLGSGMTGGYVSGNFDETVNYSIAVHQNSSGWQTTVALPPGSLPLHLDATALSGRFYIVLDVTYTLNAETTARFALVNSTQIDSNPSYIVIGFVDVPANPITALDASMFGYNDTNYPRLTPLATPQKAGFMPTSVWSQLSQFFIWESLCAADRDPNNYYLVQIAPSQKVNSVTGKRIYSYVQANVASKFPRSATGAYNGGANNDQYTKLNLQTGVISGAHQIPTNLSFAIPSVSGTPSSYQVGIVAIDSGDNVNVTYGSVYSSSSAALLDDNLPIAGKSLLQVCGFLVSTDVSGVIQPLGPTSLIDRRPFLNVGGGGSGSGSNLYSNYLNDFGNSFYSFNLPYDMSSDATTLVDTSASTGSYDFVNGVYNLSTAAKTLVTINLLSADFLNNEQDLNEASLQVTWNGGTVDPAAVYQLSRDGGVTYQTVSGMAQISESNDFAGRIVFSDVEALSSLSAYVSGNIDSTEVLDSVSGQALAQVFTISGESVFKQAEVYINKVGSPGGSFMVHLYRDSAGSPSTALADLVAMSAPVTISTLSAGNNVVLATFPTTVLKAGTYHIAIVPDATYRATWVTGTTEIKAQTDASSPTITALKKFNGTVWTTLSGEAMPYVLRGRSMDLRLKVTSSVASKIAGFHIMYSPDASIVGSKLQQQTFIFDGSSNTNVFAVTNFLPNPYTLNFYWPETGQVFKAPAFSVNGQNITFPAGTFYLPGQQITLIADQSQGSAIDTSDANAGNISVLTARADALGEQLDDLKRVQLPMISVPNTTIVGRAAIPDLSNDLGVRFGIERIMTQSLQEIQNEFGPNGERVFGTPNDQLGLIRFVGNWSNSNVTPSYGQYLQTAGSSSVEYVEITFYGTGLNLLAGTVGTQSYVYSIDGGAESSNIYPASPSDVLGGRNYSKNNTLSVVNASLGLHTVKIRTTGGAVGMTINGFEILNTSSTIKVNPGNYYVNGKKLNNAAQQSIAYNSSFDEGTLGTRGGRVQVYMKTDGTIAKTVQPVAAQGSALGSGATINGSVLSGNQADHVRDNEELIRRFSLREFGAGRSTGDDFSGNLSSVASRAFTLDDGTTTLVGSSCQSTGTDKIWLAAGGFFVITFVGTGLDLIRSDLVGGTDTVSYAVDGVVVSSATETPSASIRFQKICSGLPYGTHTVKITQVTGVNMAVGIISFNVYGPKKLGLLAGEVELADYNVMATYVANSVTTAEAISTGVLRKQAIRELVYVGTFGAITQDATTPNGFYFSNNTNGNIVQYTFFGTGFEFRLQTLGSATASPATIAVDGSTNLSGYSVGGYGGYSITAATGALNNASGTGVSGGFSVIGLTLGVHTVTITHTSTSAGLYVNSIDIITPIHSHKSNLYADIQNTLAVGSQGIQDDRKLQVLPVVTQKAWAQAIGIASNPTVTGATNIPMPDMSLTIKTQSSPLQVSFKADSYVSSGSSTAYQVYVDGVAIAPPATASDSAAGYAKTGVDTLIVPVSAGVHKVDLYWSNGGATSTNIYRRLVAREI